MKEDLLSEIDSLANRFRQKVSAVSSEHEVLKVKSTYIGREGHLTLLMKKMGSLPSEERPVIGKNANLLKNEIEKICQEQLEKIRNLSSLSRLQQERVDITLSGRTTACGSIHPITQMMRNVLRTHTSPIQIHVMRSRTPPFKVVGPGAAYRRDSDVSHTPMFHQVE